MNDDAILAQATDCVRAYSVGSIALIQRQLRLPYAKACALMHVLESRRVVSAVGPSGLRQVLDEEGNPIPLPTGKAGSALMP